MTVYLHPTRLRCDLIWKLFFLKTIDHPPWYSRVHYSTLDLLLSTILKLYKCIASVMVQKVHVHRSIFAFFRVFFYNLPLSELCVYTEDIEDIYVILKFQKLYSYFNKKSRNVRIAFVNLLRKPKSKVTNFFRPLRNKNCELTWVKSDFTD